MIAGPLTEDEAALSTTDVAPARIVHAGSLERERALALQREADALLLVAQPTRSQLLNIKVFEYLACGRARSSPSPRAPRPGGSSPRPAARSSRADDPAAIATALGGGRRR